MLVERQAFLDALHKLGGEGPQVRSEEDAHALVEEISLAFALYEKELVEKVNFLIEALGDITVCNEVAVARDLAAQAIKEASYRWEN